MWLKTRRNLVIVSMLYSLWYMQVYGIRCVKVVEQNAGVQPVAHSTIKTIKTMQLLRNTLYEADGKHMDY